MKNGRRVIAVVPARGGDPEVPYLNIKRLGALPLIVHTLQEAKKSQYIDRLIIEHVPALIQDAVLPVNGEWIQGNIRNHTDLG